MKIPSFTLVLCCALLSLVMCVIFIIVGWGLPGGRTFDFVLSQRELETLYAQYSPSDIAHHRWLTMRVDMFYPLVYGAFLYFGSMRYATKPWVYLLVLWTIIAIVFDVTECAAHIRILNGEDMFALKTVFTRAKYVFLSAPLAYCTFFLILDVLAGKNRKTGKAN